MDRLIQDVLTLSRVARTDFKLEPLDLDKLARGIVESFPNLQAPSSEILIEGRLPAVLGNPAALTQCLSNLLGNAVKFVAPGQHPCVRVWAECADLGLDVPGGAKAAGQGAMIRLFVQDNGIGIPKQAQEKIFGIFQRLSKEYERRTDTSAPLVKISMIHLMLKRLAPDEDVPEFHYRKTG